MPTRVAHPPFLSDKKGPLQRASIDLHGKLPFTKIRSEVQGCRKFISYMHIYIDGTKGMHIFMKILYVRAVREMADSTGRVAQF